MEAHAKLNLTLDILGKRPDGYHEIHSVMVLLALHDDVVVEARDEPSISLTCTDRTLETHENLCVRAAQLLQQKAPGKGCHITLTKRIPVGAGLGGGSADAAATLFALNDAWGLGLAADELMTIAAKLGSDVPFFLLRSAGVVKGRGENVRAIPPLPRWHVVIATPSFSIPTREAYASVDTGATGKRGSSSAFLSAPSLDGLGNDFEASVMSQYPTLRSLKSRLGPHSILCGSGSCVAGLFTTEAEARIHHQESDLLTTTL